jgi:hypothetical protein
MTRTAQTRWLLCLLVLGVFLGVVWIILAEWQGVPAEPALLPRWLL